ALDEGEQRHRQQFTPPRTRFAAGEERATSTADRRPAHNREALVTGRTSLYGCLRCSILAATASISGRKSSPRLEPARQTRVASVDRTAACCQPFKSAGSQRASTALLAMFPA